MKEQISKIIKEVYKPLTFIQMVDKHGAIEATKRVVEDEKQTEGFTRLLMEGRADLAVENMVIDPKFKSLFTEKAIYNSRKRLEMK
ncbi:hypothetical protein AAY42_10315 [Flagellimonas eckloniae]|uniref:Uncharacterized protein n=1 Tax=Flagellimonas eckloniae TaxID=346185 RepID=A0A0Q0XR95_9FLAO|nr:hypothetical protein AAY42_10315 [Allomuricauda eckloniae]